MQEAHKLDLWPWIALAGAIAVLAAVWATGAFASGGSPSGNPTSRDPGAAFVQSQDRSQATPGDDCPEHRNGGGGGSGGGGSGGGGSGSGDL
jgi:hypothetical protein